MFVKHVCLYDTFNQIILSLVLYSLSHVVFIPLCCLANYHKKSEHLTRTVGASAAPNSYGSPQAESHCN